MAKQIQTTFTFTSNQAANLFASWLRKFQGDSDYGCPRFLDKRSVSAQDDWCVEYIYDNTKQGHMVVGVAMGIETAHRDIHNRKIGSTTTYKCLSRNTAGLSIIYDFLAKDGECWRCERKEGCGAVAWEEDFKPGDMIGVPVRDGIPQWHEKFSGAVRLDSQ
jgi:hypothetical protein